MPGLARGGRITYEFTITPRVCACPGKPTVFATGRNLDRLIARADGYWNVFLGFFGDQVIWLSFDIIDVRDGRLVWRNGRQQTGSASNGIEEQ